MRNTAFRDRKGESKSIPRGEGFRVRVTCTQKVRGAYSLRTSDNPQMSACAQQVWQLAKLELVFFAHYPNQDMPVESDILKLELILISIFVYKGSFEFAFSSRMESFDFDLFSKIDIVDGQPLENSLFSTPINAQLLFL